MGHTSGPWIFNSYQIMGGERIGESRYYVQQQQGREIARLVIDKNRKQDILGEQRANAAVVAAAPELLEACKAMLGMDGYDETIGKIMALEAIGKALGEK